MVGGGGGAGSSSSYDFAERAKRFEAAFAEVETARAAGAVPITLLADKVSMCFLFLLVYYQ